MKKVIVVVLSIFMIVGCYGPEGPGLVNTVILL